VYARPAFVSTLTANQYFAFDNIYFRRMITSAIIGIGVIQTAHIADASITNLKVVNVAADKIVAAGVDAGLIFADQVRGRDFQPAPIGIATQLNGSLSAIATTVTVDSTTGFNNIGAFKVDKEIIYYTGKTGTTLTGLTRGKEDTIATAHSDNTVVTARGIGWNLNPERGTPNPSVVEINSQASFQGIKFDEIGARAVTAIDNNGFIRGPDRGPVPTSAVNSLFIQDAIPDSINNRMHVTIECGVDEQFNPEFVGTVNGASISHARIDILNKFGEQVGYNKYGPFNGKGTIWTGSYPRKYADAWEEAVFRVQIYNLFGYSELLYILGTNSPGFQTTSPTFLAKQNCPLDLVIIPSGPDTIVANWSPAISGAGAQKLRVRVRATDAPGLPNTNPPKSWTSWTDAITGLSSTATTTTWSGASPFTEYEFQVENTGTTGATSNIAYTLTPPQSITVSRPSPSSVVGSIQSSTSITWSWVRNATDNTDVEYRLSDNGIFAGWISLSSATQTTLTTSSLTANHTYILEVRNKWSSGTLLSNIATSAPVVTPVTVAASTDPSNLSVAALGPDSLFAEWTNNGLVSQTLEYKKRTEGVWTTVSLGAVNSYTINDLIPSTLYDVRVRATSGSNYVTDSVFTGASAQTDPYCVLTDSYITTEHGIDKRAIDVVSEYDVLMTGKYNRSDVQETVIGRSTSFMYVHNEFGDMLGCSPSHPFIANIEETEKISARQIYDLIQNGKDVYVKMNDKGREYMAKAVSVEWIMTEISVWIPKLRHPDHTFIANRFVSHNVKPVY
jgi:hypothetical protein